ncbi:MAG TPA: hypothetical protein VM715_11675, partial [Candidatus Acidoferrum sp.]|nr:hypothetical protein [Candidatus Acidoferrum sp.]
SSRIGAAVEAAGAYCVGYPLHGYRNVGRTWGRSSLLVRLMLLSFERPGPNPGRAFSRTLKTAQFCQ